MLSKINSIKFINNNNFNISLVGESIILNPISINNPIMEDEDVEFVNFNGGAQIYGNSIIIGEKGVSIDKDFLTDYLHYKERGIS